MRSVYEERLSETTEIQRAIVQEAKNSAPLCSRNFGIAWRSLHPFKSAEELAARIGCSVRAAAYELSGEREPSAQSLLALLQDVTPPKRRG